MGALAKIRNIREELGRAIKALVEEGEAPTQTMNDREITEIVGIHPALVEALNGVAGTSKGVGDDPFARDTGKKNEPNSLREKYKRPTTGGKRGSPEKGNPAQLRRNEKPAYKEIGE